VSLQIQTLMFGGSNESILIVLSAKNVVASKS